MPLDRARTRTSPCRRDRKTMEYLRSSEKICCELSRRGLSHHHHPIPCEFLHHHRVPLVGWNLLFSRLVSSLPPRWSLPLRTKKPKHEILDKMFSLVMSCLATELLAITEPGLLSQPAHGSPNLSFRQYNVSDLRSGCHSHL